MKHFENYTALSNMPLLRRYNDNNDDDGNDDDNSDTAMIWSNFDITPMMSTHQLVIVLMPFTAISNSQFPNFHTWCKSDIMSTISYAHSIAKKVPNHLLRYTNISLTMPKVDHVVIWDAPYSEAHWGLIIYR